MSELARYEGRKRLRGSLYLSVAMSLLAAMVVWVYPSFQQSFGDVDELLEAYPPQLIRLFDIRTMTSLEGFLAFELYVFGWLILLGLYAGYLAAGTLAGDMERGRLDVLLALPVSRARTLLEQYASLLVPILLVNLVTPVVIFASAAAVGHPIGAVDLLAVHALSVPYLLVCAAIGMVLSVMFDRADVAQRVALGLIFALYLVESLLEGTDYEAVGVLSPARYYDPNGILLESDYGFVGAAVLLAATAALLAGGILLFRRRDIP